MRFFAVAPALGLATVASAQMTIKVGATASDPGGIFQFMPNSVNATNGTVVTFEFSGVPGNHSVTQSTFADPCNPMPGGFDSGWVLIPSQPSETPTWNLTITDTSKPLWFFCKQLLPAPHCTAGMVGAINAPTSGANTFQNYQNNAKNFKGNPGQGEGALVGVGASASAGPGPITGVVQAFTASPVPSSAASGASGASGSGTASSSAAGSSGTTSGNGAMGVSANAFVGLISAVLGFVLA